MKKAREGEFERFIPHWGDYCCVRPRSNDLQLADQRDWLSVRDQEGVRSRTLRPYNAATTESPIPLWRGGGSVDTKDFDSTNLHQ